MIKVVGNWELSWNTPIKESELWNFVLRDFQISDWYMWPISGIRHGERQSVNLYERQSLQEILEENGDIPRIYVEPYNPAFPDIKPQDLRELEFPEDFLLIFGSAHFNPATKAREQDKTVVVPTIENKGVLWPHQCLTVILYEWARRTDRLVKAWQ